MLLEVHFDALSLEHFFARELQDQSQEVHVQFGRTRVLFLWLECHSKAYKQKSRESMALFLLEKQSLK